MAERIDTPQAIREAVQPFLWDRQKDDLHGVGAEAAALRRELGKALGSDRAVEDLLASGVRAILANTALDDQTRRWAHRLINIVQRPHQLE